ncbi:hypothetical protein AMTR_s00083p00067130 [Amborella trichopoda]|uniref:LOB domain-containing protein n=2 Tax=Amborella trichopoda TaxID=13333 RepID=W1NY08_AMBTC|nr:hypothetical protein AMTR_s00083p00067130 [Amborella trichopoda]
MKDPVYGCVGAISVLQRQVHRLQKELDAANADLIRFACASPDMHNPILTPDQLLIRRIGNSGSLSHPSLSHQNLTPHSLSHHQGSSDSFPNNGFPPTWSNTSPGGNTRRGENRM